MPSDLSPNEKEEREAERLLNKETAPSRKNRKRRGPQRHNRRTRMKIDDADLKSSDGDMTLNYKSSSLRYSIEDIALRTLMAASWDPEKGIKDELEDYRRKKTPKPKDIDDLANYEVKEFTRELLKTSKLLGDKFATFAENNYFKTDIPSQDIIDKINVRKKRFKESADQNFSNTSPEDLSASLAKLWPRDARSWDVKAGILSALQKSIKSARVPEALKAIYGSDPTRPKRPNSDAIKSILEDFKSKSKKTFDSGSMLDFAALTAAYRFLANDPITASKGDLNRHITDQTAPIYDQINRMGEIGPFVKEWEKSTKEFEREKEQDEDLSYNDLISRAESRINKFFAPDKYDDDDSPIDKESFLKGLYEVVDKSGYPEDVTKKIFKISAASYEPFSTANMKKVSSYHGVKVQHHPEADFFGKQSLNKRYFDKKDFDGIVAIAKENMKEDWYSFDWEKGAPDAPFRAALDAAIHVSNDSGFQSKIDSNTYNLLLAQLMGHDTKEFFSETFISQEKPGRRSASMTQESSAKIVRIANDIRKSDPLSAVALLRIASKMGFDIKAAEGDPPPLDILIEMQRKLLKLAESGEDNAMLLKGLTDLYEKMGSHELDFSNKSGHEASSRVASGDIQNKLKKLGELHEGDLAEILNDNPPGTDPDIEEILEWFDKILAEADAKSRTASVLVDIRTLMKVAASSPEIRSILHPYLVAAKKKMEKKPSKTSTKKKDEEKEAPKKGSPPKKEAPKKGVNPFPKKGVPKKGVNPFPKKGPPSKVSQKGKGKGRKASVEFSDRDLNW